MPYIPTRLVLSQRTGPQQRQVRIHFIWHIYPSPQLPSSHRCQYSRNCRLSRRQNCYPGVTLDSNLTLSNHISNICRSTHYHIWALRDIRRSLTDDMAKMVAASLVHSRIDYANSLVHGSTNIKKLQRLQNTAVRIILPHLSKLPSTSILRELHWLPVHSRIIYKLACLTYSSLTTGQPGIPSFFNQLLRPHPHSTIN